ncbi:MAG: CopG family transcriptional regulator [Acidobacteriota bacterium]
MKRTQLYLPEDDCKLLEMLARQSRSSVSELVRQAVREKYCARASNRREIFQSVVGLWRNRQDLPDAQTYVRALRRGRRLERTSR